MDVPMQEDKSPQSDREKWIEELESTHIESAIMNRLIMDYLVTEGYKEAAEKFEEEAGVSASAGLQGIEGRIRIRDAILNGGVANAISLINDLHPELLDDDRILLFYLQLQQLIELIREHRTEEALEFAQTSLCERGEESPECLSDLEKALALLAFEKPEESPFSDLLCPAQRHKVWSRVNAAIMEYENKESVPCLTKLIKLLIWSEAQLDAKGIQYHKMTDIAKGEIS